MRHRSPRREARPTAWWRYDVQRDTCIALLRQEVAELNPRVILVIAGSWWPHSHTDGLGLTLLKPRLGAVYVRDIADESNGRRWIFTNRPERKPQAAFLAEVINAAAYNEIAE